MRRCDRPVIKPMHCAAIPFLGQTAENVQWIDTGSEMPGFDNHVYLSDVAVRQCMSLFGYPSVQEFEEERRLRIEAEDALVALAAKLETAEAELAAVDALESAGFVKRTRQRQRAAA